jgi:DUF4097 and DUF4098 domain-containing protein YvlB
VVATRHFAIGGQGPNVQLSPSGSGLTLSSTTTGRGGAFFGDASSVDYAVEVPAGVAVNVQSSSGAVQIDGVAGPVDATTSSGGLHLSDISGPVNAGTSSGPITGTQLLHVRQAHSSSGPISLEAVFTDPTQITTSSGKVNLKLLPGTAEQLDVHSKSGNVEPQGGLQLSNGVTRRDTLTGAIGAPAAGATLSVETQSGGVVIGQ